MPREWYSPRRVGDRQMLSWSAHTPQPSMADFRMAWFRVHISRVFPHVEAMMVIMQTGSFSSVAARAITDSYIGRTAEMKLL